MSGVPDAVALLAIVFVPMLVEARRAASNERRQRARRGIEPAGDVYAVMQVAYPAVFLAMIGEGLWRVDRLVAPVVLLAPAPVAWTGVAVFLAAKILKWWAIRSLGAAWTFRVIVVPGDAPVTGGPYVWLRHPNYVAVVLELIGVALMSGARIAGPVGTLCFGALILRRIAVEDRALGRIPAAR
jgi:methyltransferase